jgi:hypothetical protein
LVLVDEYETSGAATVAACCVLTVGPCCAVTPVATGHQPADCELPRKLDGYFFFWAFSAAFVTLPWVSLKVTLCGENFSLLGNQNFKKIAIRQKYLSPLSLK